MSQQDLALLKLARLESSLRAAQLVTNTNHQPHGSNIKRAIGRGGILSHKFEVLKEGKLFVESGGRRWELEALIPVGRFKIRICTLDQLFICTDTFDQF